MYNKHNLVNLHNIYILAEKLYNRFDTSPPLFCFTENRITEMRPQVRKQTQFVENAGLFPYFSFALPWLQANVSVTGTAHYKPNLYRLLTMTVKPF